MYKTIRYRSLLISVWNYTLNWAAYDQSENIKSQYNSGEMVATAPAKPLERDWCLSVNLPKLSNLPPPPRSFASAVYG